MNIFYCSDSDLSTRTETGIQIFAMQFYTLLSLMYCTISTNCSVTHHKGRELELIETLSHVTDGLRRLSDLISREYMSKSGNCNPNYVVFKVVNSCEQVKFSCHGHNPVNSWSK